MNKRYHLNFSPSFGTKPRTVGECAPSWSLSDGGPNTLFTNLPILLPEGLDWMPG